MEIENLFRYTALAVGLKPSASQGEARLRGLYRIIYSKTISPTASAVYRIYFSISISPHHARRRMMADCFCRRPTFISVIARGALFSGAFNLAR